MLSFQELVPLAPVLILSVTVLVVMLAVAIKRSHFLIATLTVVGLNLALLSVLWPYLPHLLDFLLGDIESVRGLISPAHVGGMFMVDGFSSFYTLLILVSSLAVSTLSYYYIETFNENKEELYLMLLLAVIGAILMASSTNLASFFMSLELLSVPMYGMLAYTHERSKSLEAGVKYLALSATASAAMLMGMALIYAYAGSLDFLSINQVIATYGRSNALVIAGSVMMLMGIGFKMSLAPFHVWTPDVYQGAPMPVATFLATASKVAMFALALRFFVVTALPVVDKMNTVLTALAVLSIIVGNLLALRQSNLKRLLGYSSIAHFGYALIALVCLGPEAPAYTNIYLAAYVLTSLGAFGVLTLMSVPYRKDLDASNMSEYRGLFWRRPMLASVLTTMMLSFAGVPLTVGFIGKLFVVSAAVQATKWWLIAVVVIGSGIGLYYYLRVMVVLFMTPPDKPNFDARQNWAYQAGGVMVLTAALLVVLLGVFAQPLIDLSTLSYISAGG